MKKQNKQRDVEPKQNSTPAENRPSVSDETKQKLVKQYADRAEKESSKQNPVDWGYFNSPKFGSPVDERKQIANSAEVSPSRDLPYGARWGDFDLPKNFINSGDGFPEKKHLAASENGIHGEGLNGDPGDITQQQVDTPWNLGDNVVDNNVELFTVNNLRNIVDAMSDDAQWEKSVYNEEHPDNPISDIQVGAFPRTVPRRFFSEYPEDTDEAADFLYNNPWNKGIQDYFIDEGQYGWLYNNPDLQTQEQQADFSRMLNLLQGANDYRLRQEQADRDEYTRNRQLYGDALMELMAQRQTPQNNRSLLNEAIQQIRDQEILDNRPSPRRRNITGSAVW